MLKRLVQGHNRMVQALFAALSLPKTRAVDKAAQASLQSWYYTAANLEQKTTQN